MVISKWYIGEEVERDCHGTSIIQENIPEFPAGNEENLKKKRLWM